MSTNSNKICKETPGQTKWIEIKFITLSGKSHVYFLKQDIIAPKLSLSLCNQLFNTPVIHLKLSLLQWYDLHEQDQLPAWLISPEAGILTETNFILICTAACLLA
jgi:hypothetical protein